VRLQSSLWTSDVCLCFVSNFARVFEHHAYRLHYTAKWFRAIYTAVTLSLLLLLLLLLPLQLQLQLLLLLLLLLLLRMPTCTRAAVGMRPLQHSCCISPVQSVAVLVSSVVTTLPVQPA
jgi:hypothetical protein